jgi:hypothetical protein
MDAASYQALMMLGKRKIPRFGTMDEFFQPSG